MYVDALVFMISSTGTMDAVAVKNFPQLLQGVNLGDITASLFAKGLLTEDEKYNADNAMHKPFERRNEVEQFPRHLGNNYVSVDIMRRDLAGDKRSEVWGEGVWCRAVGYGISMMVGCPHI